MTATGPGAAAAVVRAAVLQLAPGRVLEENLRRADALISKAVEAGAQLLGLPEIFTIRYHNDLFSAVAEEIPESAAAVDASAAGVGGGATAATTGAALLALRAREYGATIFGGVVEREPGGGGALYNSVVVYGPSGELLSVYRKRHLSCTRVGPDHTAEAEVFERGTELVDFTMPRGKNPAATPGEAGGAWRPRVGLGICFDLRFDLHRAFAASPAAGPCDVLTFPSAFLHSTGEMHWELLLRARAVDNQVYILAPNHAWHEEQETKMWGHSMITGPMGHVLAEADATSDQVVVADLKEAEIADAKSRIPLQAVRAIVNGACDAENGEKVKRQRCE